MKKVYFLIFCLGCINFLSAAPNYRSDYRYLPNQVVVKLANGTSDVYSVSALSKRISLVKGLQEAVRPLVNTEKLKSPGQAKKIGLDRIYTVHVEEVSDIRKWCAELSRDPAIEWAEPVYLLPMHSVPNDQKYSVQYHLPQIGMPDAWNVVKGDSNVVIAIIDTGVDYKHKDLADHIWVNPGEDRDGDGKVTGADINRVDNDDNGYKDDFYGWDWVTGVSGTGADDAATSEDGEDEDNNPIDFDGHGSHCSGLAAATTDNGIGVASVSWGCEIMCLRIGYHTNGGDGLGFSTWMSEAFIYAADNGAKVVNLSFGTSQAVLEGARYAFINDVAITTSAGNEETIIGDALSIVPWAMAVTAVDTNDAKTWYSNYGLDADVAAPGGDGYATGGLWSTIPNDAYAQYSGTSMAAPVVAGLLGLVRSQHPEFSAAEAYYQIVETADNIDDINPEYVGLLGGRINAYRAVTETVHPLPKISLDQIDISDASGNNNGMVDPGEQIDIVVHIENEWAPASNVTLKIMTLGTNNWLTINDGEASIDHLYGIENLDENNNNSESPFTVTLVNEMPPTKIDMLLVVENMDFHDTLEFSIPVQPMVLFVDDHIGGGDGSDAQIRSYYEDMFDQLGIVCNYWLNDETPSATLLNKYPIVFWGCEWAFPSLDSDDRSVLANYLTNGGKLFLSGQDVGWDLADAGSDLNEYYASSGASSTWFETYLSVGYISDAGGKSPASPSNNSGFFDLPTFAFALPARASADQYPDEISPLGNAYKLLDYSNGSTGAVGSDDPYSTIFFAFGGLEAITDEDVRKDAAEQIITHFSTIDINITEIQKTASNGPFPITVETSSEKTFTNTELWYRVDEDVWTKLEMTTSGAEYIAEIPELSGQHDIEYFALFKAGDGTYNSRTVTRFISGYVNKITEDANGDIPEKFALLPAYPNPFNASITIPYSVTKTGDVTLQIYNMLGHRVYEFVENHSTAGYYSIIWNGKSQSDQPLTSGLYFIQIRQGNKSETSKIMFLK